MSSVTPAPAQGSQAERQRRRRRAAKLVALSVILVCVAVGATVFGLSRAWPFSLVQVLQNLQEASDSQVQIRAFHQTYFPAPGCILEEVSFRRGSSETKPLITIVRLTIRGSYLGLLSQRVRRITAEGMRIFIPLFGTGEAFRITPSRITIDEIVANGAAIEFAYNDPGHSPLRFDIHEALLRNVGWSGPLAYQVKVRNPEPPGEGTSEGNFGVWTKNDPGETPISGKYRFEQADLSVYEGIAGELTSTGKFGGKLAHIDISGTTDVPDFEVKSGHHPVRLTTEFSAYVDATRGDTVLNHVAADFWKTHLTAQGSIAASSDGKGKTALIDFKGSRARIEDLLRLFVEGNRAPMSGNVTLQSRTEIPPGPEKFLKKIKVQGGFGIAGGTFSDSSTQQDVNKLSAGARGEKDRDEPETVLTDLNGQVSLVSGAARFTDLSFRVHGTYNLINHAIDLRGQMRANTKISNTSTGTKALLLKMMEPFFKTKRKGEIVLIKISGTYEHPTFGLDLDDKHARNRPSP